MFCYFINNIRDSQTFAAETNAGAILKILCCQSLILYFLKGEKQK